jgi:isopenicillin N synthase-like dioxygenase
MQSLLRYLGCDPHLYDARLTGTNFPRGTIVLNTGDYMQRISNDIFPSTTHRVSKPRDASQRRTPRVSFPMAVYVWEEEVLEVLPCIDQPKYPPVKAIEFHTSITSKFYGDDYAVKR